MDKLKPSEVRSIEQFFQLKQSSLLKVMRQYLSTKYKTIYGDKDYVIAVGDIPIALVAHLDTVFDAPPQRIFYDKEKNVMWSPDGLGADDRAGVYAIVQIIKAGFRPTIIFTTDEEHGAIGASKLIENFPEPVTKLKYIIELDRRGSNDCVFYDCAIPKFEEYIETFGFVTNFGTFSDISVICPKWKVAGVNLSIGYYDEHSYSETLYVGQMISTIKKVEKMLKDVQNVDSFEYKEIDLYDLYGYGFDDWDPSFGIPKQQWVSWYKTDQTLLTCVDCGTTDYDYNLFPVKTEDNKTIFLCSDCVSEKPNLNWCNVCKEPFLVRSQDDLFNTKTCYDCQLRIKEKTVKGEE